MLEIDAAAPDSVAPESGAASPDMGVQPGTSPQADPKFNPQEWGYTFRSEMAYPESRDHMIELMQLGHSYKYNKPKWDQQRAELDQRASTLEQYQRLHESLESNPEFAKSLWGLYNQHTNQQQPAQNTEDPKYSELDTRLQQFEERQADAELEREMQEMMGKHPEIEWKKDLGEGTARQQLLQFMAKEKINNPELAYRAYYFPKATQNAAHMAAAKTTQNIQQAHKAGVVQQGTAGKPEPHIDHSKLNWDQLSEMALADLKSRS